MTTERDPSTRIVLSWLREDAHENAEHALLRALDEVDATPQRRSWWSAWRDFHMHKLAVTTAAAATVLVVAVVGYSLLPRLAILGPGATPPPSPALLARGNFVTVRGAVELDAAGEGSSVTGRMTVSLEGAAFTVDLQCARTTEDGFIMIGGYTIATANGGGMFSPVGTLAAIALKRGSPVKATVWSQRGGGTDATSCLGYLDEQFDENLKDSTASPDDDDPGPIEGPVELGPGPQSSEAPPSVTPSGSGVGSLPVGAHVMGSQLHGEDRVTVTIPAQGWFAPDGGSVTKDLGGDNRVTVVVVPGDYYQVPRSSCDWQIDADQRDTRMPQTADELVAYLAEQTYDTPDGSLTRDFLAEDITIDGSRGQRILDIALEYPDSDASACDAQRFCALQDRDGWGCLLSHQEPGALDTLWVVEPPANRNYLLVVASSGRPDAGLRAEMNAIVSSMTFYVE